MVSWIENHLFVEDDDKDQVGHVIDYVIFQKRVRVFHRGFKHEKTDERGKVCGQRYSEVTCAFSLIKFLTSVPF